MSNLAKLLIQYLKTYNSLKDYDTLSQILFEVNIYNFDINDTKSKCFIKSILLPLK